MKKFKFRFEAVERVRKIETEKQMKELALAIQKQEEIEAQIRDLELKIDNELLRIRDLALRGVEDEVRDLSVHFRNHLKSQIRQKREELLRAKHEVLRERKKLIERSKNQKIIEKLKEREKEKHHDELRKIENKEMDEVASNLWSYLRR